jgi:hypothetical protein
VAARPLFERALAVTEQALGPAHPNTAASLNSLAVNYYYQGELVAAAALMRRALAIYEQRLGSDHPDTQGSRQSLAAIEQQLAGTEAQPSAEAKIAQITQQAEEAVVHALAGDDDAQRAALIDQLEAQARWAEDGESESSPYLALAAHLRALKARLEPGELPEHAELRARAEAAVARALAEGNAEDRAALAERLTVTADAYAGGQPPGCPAARLADNLRALAEQLRRLPQAN